MRLSNIILETCNLEEFYFAYNRLGTRNIRKKGLIGIEFD